MLEHIVATGGTEIIVGIQCSSGNSSLLAHSDFGSHYCNSDL
jgi:hypothetical protein